MTATTTASPYLSMRDAAEHLGVSIRTIRQYVSEGRLPAYRLKSAPNRKAASNALVRIRREDLDALLIPIPTVDLDDGLPATTAG